MSNVEKSRREQIKQAVLRPIQKANIIVSVALEEYIDGNNARASLLMEYCVELYREAIVAGDAVRKAANDPNPGAPMTTKGVAENAGK